LPRVASMQKKAAHNLEPTKLGAQPVPSRMILSPLAPRDINSVLSILFGVFAVGVLMAYSFKVTPPYVIGENLVLAEVNLILFQVKPITLFQYVFFLSWGFGLNSSLSKERILKMGDQLFESLYVISWFFVMITGFEVLYNGIVLWSAGLEVQGLQNPDIIVNWWPANPYAINVVFAAKLVVLLFAMSCFAVDYMRRMRTLRDRATAPSV
jgi:hypothetical protein